MEHEPPLQQSRAAVQPLELRVCVCVCEDTGMYSTSTRSGWVRMCEEGAGGELQARGSREGLSDQPVAYVSTTQLHSSDPTETNNIIKYMAETSKHSLSYLF